MLPGVEDHQGASSRKSHEPNPAVRPQQSRAARTRPCLPARFTRFRFLLLMWGTLLRRPLCPVQWRDHNRGFQVCQPKRARLHGASERVSAAEDVAKLGTWQRLRCEASAAVRVSPYGRQHAAVRRTPTRYRAEWHEHDE
jgi:hypothetical protein